MTSSHPERTTSGTGKHQAPTLPFLVQVLSSQLVWLTLLRALADPGAMATRDLVISPRSFLTKKLLFANCDRRG